MEKRSAVQRYEGEIVLLITAFLGGTSYLFSKRALLELPALHFVSLRFALALIFFLPFVWRSLLTVNLKVLKGGLIVGSALFAGFMGLFLALPHEKTGLSAFFICTEFVFVPLVAFLLFRERVTKAYLLNLCLAFSGLLFLTRRSGVSFALTDLYLLGSAVSFAFYTVFNSRFIGFCSAGVLTFLSLATVAAYATVLAFWFEEAPALASVSFSGWLSLLYLATLLGGIRFFFQTHAQKTVPASYTSMFFLFEPIVTTVIGWLTLAETFSGQEAAGCALIIVALILSQLERHARFHAPQSAA